VSIILSCHQCTDRTLISYIRRRLKELRDPAYTVAESKAGLGVDNKQRGVEEVVKKIETMGGIEEGKA
jgi:hypothetical protein